MSISCGEKNHPFPDSLLHQIRERWGRTPTDGVSPGQPFFLTLISRLAKEAGDPDWEYPLTLQEGVLLGVDEPHRAFGRPRKNYVVSQMNMKTWPPQWGDTTMIRRKNSPMPSNRHLRRKSSWIWWKGRLQSRKQPIAAAAPLPNFVRARWRPLTKGTRFVPSMMAVLEVRIPTSNKTHQRKQQHQR